MLTVSKFQAHIPFYETLTPDDLARIEITAPRGATAGEHKPEAFMRMVDR